jgi:hypothetical protein
MGWKLSVLVFLLAVWALLSGSLIIGIPLLAYLLYGLSRRRRQTQGAEQKGTTRGGTAKWLGVFFILISLVALVSGGVFSPVVFAALGVAALLYGKSPRALPHAGANPVGGSIMLRDRLFPFRWYAVAELKLVTRNAVKVLSAVGGTLVVKLDGKAKAFLVVEESSIGWRGAEEKATESLREFSRVLTPLGAYVMPLQSKEALGLLHACLEKLKLQGSDLEPLLASSAYDVLTLRTAGWEVKEIGVFKLTDGRGDSLLKGDPVSKPVTLWEVAAVVGKRAEWFEPDEMTTFLSSVAATRGATVGERLVSVGDAASDTLTVRSLGTPAIELSRAQVRALMSIYP